MGAGSTENEGFRATLTAQNPDGERVTLIVTRQGLGRQARTWLTFNGAWKTTVVMTSRDVAQLREQLGLACPVGVAA